jgi:hypothetical protein
MKMLVQTVEVEGQGLESLIGERVTLFCANYIYAGTLAGVNTTDILLTDAAIVYETGPFNGTPFKDAQKVAKEWRIRTSAIESYGVIEGK